MDKLWEKQAAEFLKICEQFQLGQLPTEMPNPKTKGLDDLACHNLPKAIEVLKEVDIDCLMVLKDKLTELEKLKNDIKQTLDSKGRVFLCGCGATGRLSLALERIYREIYPSEENVISFMAGGDVALIASIEEFEDYPAHGARQLDDLSFAENDLLIGSTEGGETPWVIGAVEQATKISNRKPYFLYCNPDDVLIEKVRRSREVIKNEDIKKINLYCNSMALTGSTRMQASTILMLFIGLGLVYKEKSPAEVKNLALNFIDFFKDLDFQWLKSFIEEESAIYKKSEYCLYQSSDHLGISILTDTTERSPTFSLAPFENQLESLDNPSLCYYSNPEVEENQEAWKTLLGRGPRTIAWEQTKHRTSLNRLYGYNISSQIKNIRDQYLHGSQNTFTIKYEKDRLNFKLSKLQHSVSIPENDALLSHIVLKTMLNIHSTLVMGRLERYKCNIMTWVKSSNNKLIDRTARNVAYLLEQEGEQRSYEEIIYRIFECKEGLKIDEPLVSKVVASFRD